MAADQRPGCPFGRSLVGTDNDGSELQESKVGAPEALKTIPSNEKNEGVSTASTPLLANACDVKGFSPWYDGLQKLKSN